MYDSVFMRLYTNEPVQNRLSELTQTFNEAGFPFFKGNIGNLKVWQDAYKISINGSLAKHLHGNNIEPFTRQDTQRAIEKISDELSIEVKKFHVYGFETAKTFIMDYPVSKYLYFLSDNMSYFKTTTVMNQSKYYTQKNKGIKLYDKTAEMIDKNQGIPEKYQGHNLLRYELQLHGRVKKAMQMPEVKAENLYSESFFNRAINLWKDYYNRIPKIKRIIINPEVAMEDIKNFINQLALIGIQSIGGFQEVNKMIEPYRKQYSRQYIYKLRQKILSLSNNDNFTEASEIIHELNDKVNQSVCNNL